jgi:hypothetical protein
VIRVDIDAAQSSTSGSGWSVTKSTPWRSITLNSESRGWWIELKENGEIRSSGMGVDRDDSKAFFAAMAKVQDAVTKEKQP